MAKKIRIFKRFKAIKEENYRLKGQMIEKRRSVDQLREEIINLNYEWSESLSALVKNLETAEEKKKKATEHIAKMAKQRDEFLTRIQSKLPDDIVSADFSTYKLWLMEPFMEESYIPYVPPNDKDVFIDIHSALENIPKVVKNAKEKEDKQEG